MVFNPSKPTIMLTSYTTSRDLTPTALPGRAFAATTTGTSDAAA